MLTKNTTCDSPGLQVSANAGVLMRTIRSGIVQNYSRGASSFDISYIGEAAYGSNGNGIGDIHDRIHSLRADDSPPWKSL